MSRQWSYLITVSAVIFIDQTTKALVLATISFPYRLTSFLAIDVVINRGIMSGLFHSSSSFSFVLISGAVSIFLGLFSLGTLLKMRRGGAVPGEILVIAGATSNVIDRVMHGGVIDFIKLHYNQYVWPIFNVADICIVLGVMIMLWQAAGDRSCTW